MYTILFLSFLSSLCVVVFLVGNEHVMLKTHVRLIRRSFGILDFSHVPSWWLPAFLLLLLKLTMLPPSCFLVEMLSPGPGLHHIAQLSIPHGFHHITSRDFTLTFKPYCLIPAVSIPELHLKPFHSDNNHNLYLHQRLTKNNTYATSERSLRLSVL